MSQNAFDTETVNGYARIIADNHSYSFVYSFDEVVKFLAKNHRHSRKYWTFNLGFDRDSILKYLPESNLIELLKEPHETFFHDHKIMIFGKKIFIIVPSFDKKHPIKMLDIAQFFNNEPDHSLNGLAKKFLNEEKIDNVKTRNLKGHQKDWNMDDYIERNREILGQYCQKDAELTARLAEKVINTGEKLFNISLDDMVSSAGIGEKLTIQHIGGIHNYPQMNIQKAALFAQESYHGGIFITMKRGTFFNAIDLDVNSAYPYWMFDLPHWANGKFTSITSSNELLKDDKYGWLQVNVDCEWIPYKTGDKEKTYDIYENSEIELDYKIEKVYYPQGKRKAFITLLEYQFLKRHNYFVEIINGFIWRQTRDQFKKPFSWMKEMYIQKAEIKKKYGKESMEYMLVKIALNGTYGKTAQKQGKGKLKNWFYASYITAGTRIQIIEFLIVNNYLDKIINIATDGVLLTEFNNEITSSDEFGKWEIKKWEEILVIGNGMLQGINPDKSDTRMRGITNKRNYNIKHELQKNREKNKLIPLITKTGRPIHISEAIKHHKILTKEDINTWKKVSRVLNPASDTKRKWQPFINFDQLLSGNEESTPYTVKELDFLKNRHIHKKQKTLDSFK